MPILAMADLPHQAHVNIDMVPAEQVTWLQAWQMKKLGFLQ